MTTETDPQPDTQHCWLSIDEMHPDVACNREAPNGAGICDEHLELLRGEGK